MMLQDIPVRLGGPGATLSLALNVLLGLATAYSLWKFNQSKHWESTAGAYEKELSIQRQRADRISDENKELIALSAELRAKTDLTELQKAMLLQTQDARGYETRNQEVHQGIVNSLQELTKLSQERYAAVTATIEGQTVALQDTTKVLKSILEEIEASHRRADSASGEHGAAADAAAKSGKDLIRP